MTLLFVSRLPKVFYSSMDHLHNEMYKVLTIPTTTTTPTTTTATTSSTMIRKKVDLNYDKLGPNQLIDGILPPDEPPPRPPGPPLQVSLFKKRQADLRKKRGEYRQHVRDQKQRAEEEISNKRKQMEDQDLGSSDGQSYIPGNVLMNRAGVAAETSVNMKDSTNVISRVPAPKQFRNRRFGVGPGDGLGGRRRPMAGNPRFQPNRRMGLGGPRMPRPPGLRNQMGNISSRRIDDGPPGPLRRRQVRRGGRPAAPDFTIGPGGKLRPPKPPAMSNVNRLGTPRVQEVGESKSHNPYAYRGPYKDVQGLIDEEFQENFVGFPKRPPVADEGHPPNIFLKGVPLLSNRNEDESPNTVYVKPPPSYFELPTTSKPIIRRPPPQHPGVNIPGKPSGIKKNSMTKMASFLFLGVSHPPDSGSIQDILSSFDKKSESPSNKISERIGYDDGNDDFYPPPPPRYIPSKLYTNRRSDFQSIRFKEPYYTEQDSRRYGIPPQNKYEGYDTSRASRQKPPIIRHEYNAPQNIEDNDDYAPSINKRRRPTGYSYDSRHKDSYTVYGDNNDHGYEEEEEEEEAGYDVLPDYGKPLSNDDYIPRDRYDKRKHTNRHRNEHHPPSYHVDNAYHGAGGKPDGPPKGFYDDEHEYTEEPDDEEPPRHENNYEHVSNDFHEEKRPAMPKLPAGIPSHHPEFPTNNVYFPQANPGDDHHHESAVAGEPVIPPVVSNNAAEGSANVNGEGPEIFDGHNTLYNPYPVTTTEEFSFGVKDTTVDQPRDPIQPPPSSPINNNQNGFFNAISELSQKIPAQVGMLSGACK